MRRLPFAIVLLGGTIAFAQAKSVDQLAADLQRVETELASAQQGLGDAQRELAVLRQEVDELKRAGQATGAETARLDAIDQKLAELSSEVATGRLPPAPLPSRAAGEGLELRTADGNMSVRLGGYVEPRYQLDDDTDRVTASSFSLRRARIDVSGDLLGPRLGYRFLVEVAGRPQLADAYAHARFGSHLTLRAGQFEVPFSAEWLVPEERLQFFERPVATDEFRYDRDVGVSAGVRVSHLHAILGVFNGSGPVFNGNDNIDPLLVLRVYWGHHPEEADFEHAHRPRVSVGLSGSFENAPEPATYRTTAITVTDVDGDGRRDNVRVVQGAVDAQLAWRGLYVSAEGYLRHEDWGVIGAFQMTPFTPKQTYGGGFVQATYFVRPSWLVGVRASAAELSPLGLSGRVQAQTLPDQKTEGTALVEYLHHHKNEIRVGLMGSVIHSKPDADDLRLILQAHLGF